MPDRVDLSFSSLDRKNSEALEAVLATTIFSIPSVNGGVLLQRMLPTLNIPPHIVYVLDQGSIDDTTSVCKKFGANVIQLNTPHTYTECCNISIDMAVEKGAEFLFISNNDITFTTDVARELLHEMLADDALGIVSCSQVITDEAHTSPILSNRVYWDLSGTIFEHDLSTKTQNYYRLESDFCEMTCALLRVSAVKEVGGFDNAFGFYHEDADLGFRLREAGYTTAYLPQSQIQHYTGSTFKQGGLGKKRLAYIENSKALFQKKHSGYGAMYTKHQSDIPSSWTIINRHLHSYMTSLGMIDEDRPALTFTHPGGRPFDYLYSVWETSGLPQEWLRYKDVYKAVFLPSFWNLECFHAHGFHETHYVPLGVETDEYNPWGSVSRDFDEPTFLWFSRTQYRKGQDVLYKAWQAFRQDHKNAKLIILGHGVLLGSDIPLSKMRRWREYLIYEDRSANITYKEIIKPLETYQVAEIYRSVDCLLVTSRSEGFGFNVVEALACGCQVVFPSFGATRDMIFPDALTFSGDVISADYSDKGFFDVGDWWEPRVEEIIGAVRKAITMSVTQRAGNIRQASNLVRSKFTWRNTTFLMRQALMQLQSKRDPQLKRPKYHDAVDMTRWLSEPERVADTVDISILLLIEIDTLFKNFNTDDYAKMNKDLISSNMDPLWHFIAYGWSESGRFDQKTDPLTFFEENDEARLFIIHLHGLGDTEKSRDVNGHFLKWECDKLRKASERAGVSNYTLLKMTYQTILRRPPDPQGLQYFIGQLFEGKMSRADVIDAIAGSAEAARAHNLN